MDDSPPVPPRTSSESGGDPRSDISFSNLFQDLRTSMDCIHLLHGNIFYVYFDMLVDIHGDGSLKSKVLADMPKYIKKTPELANFLDRLRQNNRTSFLLTNSEFYYTDKVMSYLLTGQNPKYENWKQYWGM